MGLYLNPRSGHRTRAAATLSRLDFLMPEIWMSTSTLENAVALLLNCGCLERRENAEEAAEHHFEHVFRVTIEPVEK